MAIREDGRPTLASWPKRLYDWSELPEPFRPALAAWRDQGLPPGNVTYIPRVHQHTGGVEYVTAWRGEEVLLLTGRAEGVEELLDVLEPFLPEGPQLFPDGMVTDQPERQVCAELIREKLLLCLDKEIPHGTAVEITTFSERDDGIIDLDATIYCEKASHKGIIIGKGGAMLKKISTLARTDIEAFMGTKVFLQTWVKVKENWRDSDVALSNFGYKE